MLYSSRWKQLRGFADEEIGHSYEEWSRRIHPDDRQRVLTNLETHLARHTPFFAEEYRARRKDDSWMWVTDRGLAKRDDNGRAVRMVGSENDISERKQAEMALRQLNETLEQRVAERTAVAETRALQLQHLALELTDTEDRERRQIALILHDDLQQCLRPFAITCRC
ncbi:MAG: PAS domain-containing protein [Desulfobacterales bacterium]